MKALWIGTMLLLTVAGCQKSAGPPTIKTLPVTGTVTLDGKPLSGADVVFMSAETSGAFAGRTDDKGEYQLQSFGAAKGSCQGMHRVTISRLVKPDGSLPGPDEPPANSGATETLPGKYSDAAFTTLSADVPAEGKNFDFDLQSK